MNDIKKVVSLQFEIAEHYKLYSVTRIET